MWWLRSPLTNKGRYSGSVGDDGWVNSNHVVSHYGARPAFNLNLSSVLLTSKAAGGKAGSSTLAAIATGSNTDWKLTLKDSSRGFANNGTAASLSAYQGEAVTIQYKNAKTGSSEYISALLCDSAGNALYYASVQAESASGQAVFTLPSGVPLGSYTLKVFNERKNGDKQSDYASDFVSFPLTVTGKASVAYVDAKGDTPADSPVACTPVTASGITWGAAGQTTWYAVTGDVTIDSRVKVQGSVNLILCDEKKLTAKEGITVSGNNNSLTIWAQSSGTGKLYATGSADDAGIGGGDVGAGGTVTVNGGTVYATGDDGGAGIGGGNRGAGGTVKITGGRVYAQGDVAQAAIGRGFAPYGNLSAGSLEIYAGAKVTADANKNSASPVEETGSTTARVNACRDNQYAAIEPCENHSYTKYKITDTTHTPVCAYCLNEKDATPHVYQDGKCDCGKEVQKATVTTLPTARKWVSDGNAQALAEAGAASGGTMVYAMTTTTATPNASAYSEAIPTEKEIGQYYVWYKAQGDGSHADSDAAYVTARICFPVTFKVVGGTWTDGKTEKTLDDVSRYKDEDLALTLQRSDIPQGTPNSGHTSAGTWNEDPSVYISEKTITSAKTFTFTEKTLATVTTAPTP